MPKRSFQCGALYTKHVLLLLMVCLLAVPAGSSAQPEYRSKLVSIESEIRALQQSLDDSVSVGKQQRVALRKEEIRLVELEKQSSLLEGSIFDKSLKLEQLAGTLKNQLLEQQGQIENLALLVHSGFSMGSNNKLKMLLSQQNPYLLGRLTNYYNYISQARSQRISLLLKETLKTRQGIKEYQIQQQKLKDEKARLAYLVIEADKALIQRAQKLTAVDVEINSTKLVISAQREDKLRLQALLVGLKKVKSGYMPYISPNAGAGGFSKQRNKLSQPLGGIVSQQFGSKDSVTGLSRQGVLIQSASGQPVHAVFDGEAIFSDWLRGYGQLIILDHGDGYMSLYGHNQDVFVGVGDKVAVGQVISSAGVSGGLAQAGLYFEIRHNGDPINPAGWLQN
ncbi:MAG: peptidoglycan DD-metalloendopeptidase family protein [Arenicellaceae bacterium]|nr:peptidoglycan DD-metalloendopeptidase family protein [Arenicellaceae bacterium]